MLQSIHTSLECHVYLTFQRLLWLSCIIVGMVHQVAMSRNTTRHFTYMGWILLLACALNFHPRTTSTHYLYLTWTTTKPQASPPCICCQLHAAKPQSCWRPHVLLHSFSGCLTPILMPLNATLRYFYLLQVINEIMISLCMTTMMQLMPRSSCMPSTPLDRRHLLQADSVVMAQTLPLARQLGLVPLGAEYFPCSILLLSHNAQAQSSQQSTT